MKKNMKYLMKLLVSSGLAIGTCAGLIYVPSLEIPFALLFCLSLGFTILFYVLFLSE